MTTQQDGSPTEDEKNGASLRGGGGTPATCTCGQKVAPPQQRTALPSGAESVRSDCLHHHNLPNGGNCAFAGGAWPRGGRGHRRPPLAGSCYNGASSFQSPQALKEAVTAGWNHGDAETGSPSLTHGGSQGRTGPTVRSGNGVGIGVDPLPGQRR